VEAYKSSCPDCKKTYFWVGFKTGLGKTPEQLKQMEKDHNVCLHCGSAKINTTLDTETEVGKAFDDSINSLASFIDAFIK